MEPVLDPWPPGTVTILSTLGADGDPHAIPVSTARVAGPRRVLLALAPARGSLERLRRRPRVALTVMGAGVALTAHGSARVLADEVAGVAAVAIEVDSVRDHRQPTFEIESGVGWRWVDDGARERDLAVREALDGLA
jgi:nitroimidazol reductase NimA-like FMN-containing flavoprotein (pyridoxamine 5'-phosphate oxidase superfamily)